MVENEISLLNVLTLTDKLRAIVAAHPAPRGIDIAGKIFAAAHFDEVRQIKVKPPFITVQFIDSISDQSTSLSELKQLVRDRYLIGIYVSRKIGDTDNPGGEAIAQCQRIRDYLLYLTIAGKLTSRYEAVQYGGSSPLETDDALVGFSVVLDLPWWLESDDTLIVEGDEFSGVDISATKYPPTGAEVNFEEN